MRYRLQRHDGTDCSATMVPITVLRMVPIQRYRQCYCNIMLLGHYVVVLLRYCNVMLLRCQGITLLQYYNRIYFIYTLIINILRNLLSSTYNLTIKSTYYYMIQIDR